MFKWLKSVGKIFSTESADRSLVKIDDDGFFSEDIYVNIEDIISGEDGEEVSRLHVISLTEFHQSLGKLWDSREGTIFRIVEAVLRDRMGPGNKWEHKSPEVYILLFLTLSEMEADALAFEISEEIGMKIIGERFDGERRPLIRCAGVDPKEALKEDGTFDISILEKMGRGGEAAGDANKGTNADNKDQTISRKAQKSEDPSNKPVAGGPDWKKNQFDHRDSTTDWKERRHKSAKGTTDWRKAQRDKERASDPNWVSMHDTGSRPDEKKAPSYFANFLPCWLSEAQSLNHYRVQFNWTLPDKSVLGGAEAYARISGAQQLSKTDQWVLQHCGRGLFALVTRKIVTPIFVPVHSSSLRGPFLEDYLRALGKMSEGIRQKYLIIEILDDGNWQKNDLQTLQEQLKELCKGVAFSPDSKSGFQPAPVKAMDWTMIDLARVDESHALDEAHFKKLIADIRNSGSKVGVLGITQRDQFTTFLDLEVDLLAGPALVKPTDALKPPFKLARERLIKAAGA